MLTLGLSVLLQFPGPLQAQGKIENGESDIETIERAKKDRKFEEAMRLRQKAIDKGKAYDPDEFEILGLDGEVRDIYWDLSDDYWSAIAAGAPKDHERVKAAHAYVLSCRAELEKAGVVLLLSEDDPLIEKLADADEFNAYKQNSSRYRYQYNAEERELERYFESRLYGAYRRVWEGSLKLQHGDPDEAQKDLEQGRKMLERELKELPSAVGHPVFKRAREALEPLAQKIEAAFKEIGAKREAAEKALSTLQDYKIKLREFKESIARTPSEVEKLEEQAQTWFKFKKETLPWIRIFVTEFEGAYGASRDAVRESYNKIYATRTGISNPDGSSDYEDFKTIHQQVADSGKTLAKNIVDKIRMDLGILDAYDEEKRTEVVLALLPKVDIALQLDPENPEVQKLKGELKAKAGNIEEKLKEAASAARLPESGYTGDDGDAILEAIMEYLREDGNWGGATERRREPLAAVLTSDWYVNGRNLLGNPVQYGIEVEVAMRHDPSTGWEQEEWRVYKMSFYTEESASPVKGPPFDSVGAGRSYRILPENLPAGAGSVGGGGTLFGVCFGFACCSMFLLAAGGGAYYAFQQQAKAKAAAAGGPTAGPTPPAAGSPPPPPA